MIKVHEKDMLICDVYKRQSSYDKVLERSQELGFENVISCIITKAITLKEPMRTVAQKLSTSEQYLYYILEKLNMRDALKKDKKRSHVRTWMWR